jgi:hypothetical protein
MAEFSNNNEFTNHEVIKWVNTCLVGLVHSDIPDRLLAFRHDQSLIVVARLSIIPANIRSISV